MIFPKPQKLDIKRQTSLKEKPVLFLELEDNALACAYETLFGAELSQNGNVRVKAYLRDTKEFCYVDEQSRLSREKYIINIGKENDIVNASIGYSSKRGLWYALSTIQQMIDKNTFLIGEIEDYPLFETRGIIEGFYGNPWSFEQRCDMLKLMTQNKLNTFYYAPKDDDYHRRKWNEIYPEKELSDLKKLVKIAKDFEIDFHYCIAPGLSMRYTSEKDFNALLEKTRQLYSIGITHFGLLLDDIPEELAFDEDKSRYGETVNAHIDLINRYFAGIREIDGGLKLTICPMQYHGRGTEYYIAKLGKGIVPEADMFWTGQDICSRELTVHEAVRFLDNTNHRPLYWDNYPVNDAEMVNEMHIGPIIGREDMLFRYSRGIIANCMEYFESTKIPLLTIADYLWNPIAYKPEESFENALDTIIGTEHKEDFRLFADHLRTSCLKDANSKIMEDILSRAGAMMVSGQFEEAFLQVKDFSKKLTKAANFLKERTDGIYGEVKRWSDKFAFCAEIFALAVQYMDDGDDETAEKLVCLHGEYNAEATVLTGFCFRAFIEFLTNR